MRHLRLFHRAGPLIVALLTAALLVAPTGAAARTTADTAGLQIVDLGTLGGTSSWARDINDEGQVVGDSQTINDHDGRAFVWRDGRMKQLGTLGGRFSAAFAINEWGDVVGQSQTEKDIYLHAFLWRDGRMLDLGTMGGIASWATDINDRREVVGLVEFSGWQFEGFLWRDGRMTSLGAFQPEAINNLGQIVGEAPFDDGAYDAAIWENGDVTRLASPLGAEGSSAKDINDQGQIAGYSLWPTGDSINRATLWTDGVPVDLGGPGGSSQAWGINDDGQVVGSRGPGSQAVLRDHGVAIDLATLGVGTAAEAINNSGHVVGNSQISGMPFVSHAVLWR